MAVISFEHEEIPVNSTNAIANGTNPLDLSLDELFHAAITTGHGPNWQAILGTSIAGIYEMMWKSSALLMAVREADVPRQQNSTIIQPPVARLIPTDRYTLLDPSERRAASYHLGMLLATGWARRALAVPWLLHLDIYWAQLGIPLSTPNGQRPDLVGWSPAGGYVVVECKGRANVPNDDEKNRAKDQARRVTNVGGQAPAVLLAHFAFFGCDKASAGRKKARVLKALVVDPPADPSPDDPIELPDLTPHRFLQLYYERLQPFFSDVSAAGIRDEIVWRRFNDLGVHIGIHEKVWDFVKRGEFEGIPPLVALLDKDRVFKTRYPGWTGDGIVLETDQRWKEQFRAVR